MIEGITEKNKFPKWIEKQLPEGIKRNYFKSSYGRIHYLTRGRGQKVVLLHGNPTWSFLWRKVIRELDPEKFEIYAPDLLNLGFSDFLEKNAFNMANHVVAFEEFFNHIDISESILVVQDWGGPIGLSSALKSNYDVGALVVLNTGVLAPKPPFRVSKFHTFVNRKIIPDFLFNVLRYPMYSLHGVQFDKSSIRNDVARAYRYPMKLKSEWRSALKFARMVPNSTSHPSYALFGEMEKYCLGFKGPVEIIWGKKDPILGRGLKKVAEIFKDKAVNIVSAGHFLQEECPEEIAFAIKRIKERM